MWYLLFLSLLLFCFCFPSFTDKQLIIFGVNIWDFSPLHLLRLGFIVVLVFGASFGPFIAMVGCFNNHYCKPFPFSSVICFSMQRKRCLIARARRFCYLASEFVLNSPDGEREVFSWWGGGEFKLQKNGNQSCSSKRFLS